MNNDKAKYFIVITVPKVITKNNKKNNKKL